MLIHRFPAATDLFEVVMCCFEANLKICALYTTITGLWNGSPPPSFSGFIVTSQAMVTDRLYKIPIIALGYLVG